MIKNLLLLTFILSFSACATTYPENSCNDSYWLEFSQLKLCTSKNSISAINLMNSELPSMSLMLDGSEYIFIKQVAENVSGNLHLKYDLTLSEYFSALVNNTKTFDISTALKVHELTSSDEISEFSYGNWRIYVLISNTRSFDELFILNNENDEYIYQIGGEFNKQQALELISQISFPII